MRLFLMAVFLVLMAVLVWHLLDNLAELPDVAIGGAAGVVAGALIFTGKS